MFLPNRSKAVHTDDNMVQNADVQQLASLNDRAGHVDIFRAFGWISRWVIMRHHNGIRVFADHQLKDFAHSHSCGILRTLIQLL